MKTISITVLSLSAQRRADRMGDDEQPVYARPRGRGHELTQIIADSPQQIERDEKSLAEQGWYRIDFTS